MECSHDCTALRVLGGARQFWVRASMRVPYCHRTILPWQGSGPRSCTSPKREPKWSGERLTGTEPPGSRSRWRTSLADVGPARAECSAEIPGGGGRPGPRASYYPRIIVSVYSLLEL